ncbi:MAG: hypothetical protein E7447_06580 [Ruminococcaceae bacterium]|nr:hypothetical protein [Oscillospiraceae bacterium]
MKTMASALNHIDDELIAEAMETTPRSKRNPILRWCILAACLVLLIGTVTVAATTDFGTQLLQTFTGETRPNSDWQESGFDLRIQIRRIPTSSLTGEIQEVPAIIRHQIENHKLWYSQLPDHFLKKFASPEEARQYIGLETLRIPDWNLDVKYTSLSAFGDHTTGEIRYLTLEIFYRKNNINVQARATAYTELWDSDTVYHSARSHQETTYTESFYTTANGLQCHIIASSPLPSGYKTFSCFLVYDGILYHLNVSHQPADETAAKEIIHQWADQFGN